MALLLGLQLCFQKGFEQVCEQSNSLVLIGILQRHFHCPWHTCREVRQICQLVADSSRFSHCFREANSVADILANVGVTHHQHTCIIYDHLSMFPKLARGEIRLDRLSMSSVRRIKREEKAVVCVGKFRTPGLFSRQ